MKLLKTLWFIFLLLTIISCKKENINEKDDVNPLDDDKLALFKAHGFNDSIFTENLTQIETGFFGNMNSLLVMHGDELITENYFDGWTRDRLHPIASCTKSITSLLIGKAIDEQLLSLDDKMLSFFENYNISNMSPLKSSITLENMLTMSAGFEWDEWSIPYGETGNSLSDMYNTSNDYISYTLNLPIVNSPGEVFEYNSGITFMFGSILQTVTGKSVESFAEEQLFNPLGITNYTWNTTQGLAHCGGGLSLRPVDLAKIGSLVLNNGSFDGAQLISQNWITESMKTRHNISSYDGYGYHWFTYIPPLNGEIIYNTKGYGGQALYIVPEYDMVIVLTASNSDYANPPALSETRLILDMISCSPAYESMIMNTYETKLNLTDHSQETYGDLFFLVRMLARYKKYQEALNYLTLFEDDPTILSYNFHFSFYMGYLNYHLQNYEQARNYLNQHLEQNNNSNIQLAFYYNQAREMLDIIN